MNYDTAGRWNERVTPTDTNHDLGDFAMGDPERYPGFHNALQGDIILVRGNHDEGKIESVIDRIGFEDALDNSIVEVEFIRLCLNHCPMGIPDHRSRPLARPKAPGLYNIILCGHVHQQFKVHRGNVNVGVNVWGFAPLDVGGIRAGSTLPVTHA